MAWALQVAGVSQMEVAILDLGTPTEATEDIVHIIMEAVTLRPDIVMVYHHLHLKKSEDPRGDEEMMAGHQGYRQGHRLLIITTEESIGLMGTDLALESLNARLQEVEVAHRTWTHTYPPTAQTAGVEMIDGDEMIAMTVDTTIGIVTEGWTTMTVAGVP